MTTIPGNFGALLQTTQLENGNHGRKNDCHHYQIQSMDQVRRIRIRTKFQKLNLNLLDQNGWGYYIQGWVSGDAIAIRLLYLNYKINPIKFSRVRVSVNFFLFGCTSFYSYSRQLRTTYRPTICSTNFLLFGCTSFYRYSRQLRTTYRPTICSTKMTAVHK